MMESRKRSLDAIEKQLERLKKLNNPAFNRNIEALERIKKRFKDNYEAQKKRYEQRKKEEEKNQKKPAQKAKPKAKTPPKL